MSIIKKGETVSSVSISSKIYVCNKCGHLYLSRPLEKKCTACADGEIHIHIWNDEKKNWSIKKLEEEKEDTLGEKNEKDIDQSKDTSGAK